MMQAALWHEDIYEALGTDIQALGGNKKVGAMLWPEKSPDKAGEHLANCLNRTRHEKLDPEQVLFVIRKARGVGSYAAIWYMAEFGNFTRPEPIEPEDRKAKLQREYIEAAKEMRRIAEDIERVSE